MNENKIIETLKYISKFVENRHDEGLGDYLHIVIGRTDINVIDETIYLLERKQKEIVRYKKEIKNQQKEIEEKTTIIMAGAEKVKQLEKGNRSLMESRIKWKSRYYKEKAKNKNYISKDKIRETLKKYDKDIAWANADDHYYFVNYINELLEEN